MIYLMLIMMNSMMMISAKSPILIGVNIFFQAFMYTLLISSISFSMWSSYLLFIVCLGGILIVFLYVIMTLTIGMNPGKTSITPLILFVYFIFFEKNEYSGSSETQISNMNLEMKFQESFSIMKICSMTSLKFSIFLMILLFITMVMVVNLTKKKGSAYMKI